MIIQLYDCIRFYHNKCGIKGLFSKYYALSLCYFCVISMLLGIELGFLGMLIGLF